MSDLSQRLAQLSPAKRALLELETRHPKAEPIAIIGAGCRFPGGADNLDAYWRILRDGKDAISEIPPDRWDVARYYDVDPDMPGKMATRWGGFLDQVDQFDAPFFGISPREAARMDPQQRLLLEVTWEALESAGYAPDGLSGANAGVFVGISTSDYAQLQMKGIDPARVDAYAATGNAFSVACGRISYLLGLVGPSLAVDTACSSSLVALHLAVRSLREGECTMALASGVNVMIVPEVTINFSKARMMAADGRCKTFDDAADGYVRGEGCGVVVLKPLFRALADRDNILALVRGSAVNQDGRTSGLTAPNGLAQQAVMQKALADAGVDPAEVGYVEAHGTGTSLGDPVELRAIAAIMESGGARQEPLAVGSVKTNIGHLEAAAGMAGLLKVVLALQHREIPPHLHLKQLNSHIPPQKTLTIPTARTPWPPNGRPRIAGVSSFGFSGTNAHVVVQEAPVVDGPSADVARPCHLLTLSAKTDSALLGVAARYAEHFSVFPDASIRDIEFTTNAGRSHFPHRLAVVAASVAEARGELAAFAAGKSSAAIRSNAGRRGARPRIAFLFSGQGSQYPGMGRQLYETEPKFRRVLELCDEVLRPYLERPLLEVMYPDGGTPTPLDETAYAQPALYALECAMADVWRSWGIEPGVVLGHSLGEYSAAYVAGVFDLAAGLKLVAERGRLMQGLPKIGEMAVVFSGQKSVAAALAGYEDRVAIAAINGPKNTVISGERKALHDVIGKLEREGYGARALTSSHAFHSPLVDPVLAQFERTAQREAFRPLKMRLISGLTGGMLKPGEQMGAGYWRHQLREPVRFHDGMSTLAAHGYDACIEIGPSPTLLAMARQCRLPGEISWLPSLRERQEDWRVLLTSMASLYAQGADPNWTEFHRQGHSRRLPLPTYPFERERCWVETDSESADSPPGNDTRHGQKLLRATHFKLAHPPETLVWELEVRKGTLPFLDDHRVLGLVLAPASLYIEMARSGFTEAFGNAPAAVTDLELKKALFLPDGASRILQMIVSPGRNAEVAVRFYSRSASPEDREDWILHATANLQRESLALAPE